MAWEDDARGPGSMGKSGCLGQHRVRSRGSWRGQVGKDPYTQAVAGGSSPRKGMWEKSHEELVMDPRQGREVHGLRCVLEYLSRWGCLSSRQGREAMERLRLPQGFLLTLHSEVLAREVILASIPRSPVKKPAATHRLDQQLPQAIPDAHPPTPAATRVPLHHHLE